MWKIHITQKKEKKTNDTEKILFFHGFFCIICQYFAFFLWYGNFLQVYLMFFDSKKFWKKKKSQKNYRWDKSLWILLDMIAERRISHLTLQTRTAQVLYEGQTEDSSRCKLFTQPCMLHLIIRHRQKHFFLIGTP